MTRVIGGSAGGRRLAMPRGRSTRPTADRVREGLFSALGGDLSGRSFLDLYAGSGAVGLEAASRGAAPVVLVERDAAAITALRGNVKTLGLADVHVQGMAVSRFLAEAPTTFDIVFIDPPYADPVDETLVRVAPLLNPSAVIVVERATRSDAPRWPAGIEADRSRRYGDTTLWYGRRP